MQQFDDVQCQECNRCPSMTICPNCNIQICIPCSTKHGCDAILVQIEEQLQKLTLQKLPSIPEQVSINKMPNHTHVIPNACVNYGLCKALKQENSNWCSLDCQIFEMSLNCAKLNQWDRFRESISKLLKAILPQSILNSPRFSTKCKCFNIDEQSICNTDDEIISYSVLAYPAYQGGQHEWVLRVCANTKMYLKVGVSLNDNFKADSAFSDYPFGYAYFTMGSLRQGNNANGQQYGVKIRGAQDIRVKLNMDEGTLGFAINDVDYGIAFSDDRLKHGPIYPAICFLQQGSVQYYFIQ